MREMGYAFEEFKLKNVKDLMCRLSSPQFLDFLLLCFFAARATEIPKYFSFSQATVHGTRRNFLCLARLRASFLNPTLQMASAYSLGQSLRFLWNAYNCYSFEEKKKKKKKKRRRREKMRNVPALRANHRMNAFTCIVTSMYVHTYVRWKSAVTASS